MRYGMRLGRRSWVSGGGGVLIASVLSGLIFWMLMIAAHALATAVALVAGLTLHGLRNTKAARRAQLALPLRGCIDDVTLRGLGSSPKVWAVYAVENEFHHGVHPKKGEELLRLFPNSAQQIARIAVFPDAGRARAAASQLEAAGLFVPRVPVALPEQLYARKGLGCHRTTHAVVRSTGRPAHLQDHHRKRASHGQEAGHDPVQVRRSNRGQRAAGSGAVEAVCP